MSVISPPPGLLTVAEKLGDYSHLGYGHTVRSIHYLLHILELSRIKIVDKFYTLWKSWMNLYEEQYY